MLKLLIADGTDSFRTALSETLQDTYLVQSCTEGDAALYLMRTFLPDLIILDLTLPGIDGLSLIQKIHQEPDRPAILATTRFVSDYVLGAASQIGVDYMMVKPCSTEAIAARLEHLACYLSPEQIAQPDLRAMISNLLLLFGIQTNRKGYTFLREAIGLFRQDPGQSMTKELYPAVGALCNADSFQVERAIRSAIEKAWTNREEGIWRRYFAPNRKEEMRKPTNSEFISRLADALLLQTEDQALPG